MLRRPWRKTVAASAARPSVDASTLRRVDELVAQDRPDVAVDVLAAAAREGGDPATLVRLRDLRRQAAHRGPTPAGRDQWPPLYDDPFPEVDGQIPEIGPDGLTTEILGGAVAHHGALLVRGLVDDEHVAATVTAIDRAQERQSTPDSAPDEWFHPVDTNRRHDEKLREMVLAQGGTWLADSPAATATILQMLEAVGFRHMVEEHFGERPYLSLQKSTLRRVPPEPRITGWHQDGSFLDDDVRTMNVWIALSPCGGDHPASGLELLPRRVEEILPTDPEWTRATIAFDLVDEMAEQTPTVRPRFEPGDALVFDEHLVHRTSLEPGLTEDRYALECWLFAPSHTSASYTPFLV